MSLDAWLVLVFWLSFAGLLFTFFGYPILIAALARLSPRRHNPDPIFKPRVSVVIAVHNEASRIQGRIQNLLETSYPANLLEIVVVSDGSTDETVERLRGFRAVRVIARPHRSGKAACLNEGISAAAGEVIVLCDVRQRFAEDTIPRLVSHFADPAVGAVSGALEIDPASSAVGAGVDAYWRLEKFIRRKEAQWDSSVGCTGAVYAIRKVLFQPLPDDTLLDDVVIPMRIAAAGARVLFDPEALAWDPQSLEPERERMRKQRTLAGNYQMLFRYWRWLLPGGHRLWWQLISHKYLRLAAPLLLLTLLASNALLASHPFYRLIFAGQCLFYVLALLGAISVARKIKAFSIPAGFVFLNLMSLSGLKHYLCGSYEGGRWPATSTAPRT